MTFVLLVLVAIAAGAAVVKDLLGFLDDRRAALPPARARFPLADLPDGLAAATRTTIGAARPGSYVAIRARVVGRPPLTSPISGRRCVVHDLVIVRDQVNPPRIEHRVVRAEPFEIADETGTALVDPGGAYVRLTYETSEPRPHLWRDQAVATELADRGPIEGWEGTLGPQDLVLVIGAVEAPGDGPDAVFRRSGDATIRIVGGANRPALIGNRPEDLAELGWDRPVPVAPGPVVA